MLIAELEPFDRELFGGTVMGAMPKENATAVVTIRCAKFNGNQVRLNSLAPIVPPRQSASGGTASSSLTMLNVLTAL